MPLGAGMMGGGNRKQGLVQRAQMRGRFGGMRGQFGPMSQGNTGYAGPQGIGPSAGMGQMMGQAGMMAGNKLRNTMQRSRPQAIGSAMGPTPVPGGPQTPIGINPQEQGNLNNSWQQKMGQLGQGQRPAPQMGLGFGQQGMVQTQGGPREDFMPGGRFGGGGMGQLYGSNQPQMNTGISGGMGPSQGMMQRRFPLMQGMM